MIHKKLLLLFLLFSPIFQTEAESTTDRSSIMRKMNRAGLDWSDNKTENIKTNRSSSLNDVILERMMVGPDMEDNDNTMEANFTIKKCCGPTEVLDEWYKCSERGSHDGLIAMANLTDENIPEISFQYQSFSCPKRKVNEYSPINIFNDGSIEIETDRNNTKIIEDYHCLDQTEIQQNYTDGLHVIICDSIGIILCNTCIIIIDKVLTPLILRFYKLIFYS